MTPGFNNKDNIGLSKASTQLVSQQTDVIKEIPAEEEQRESEEEISSCAEVDHTEYRSQNLTNIKLEFFDNLAINEKRNIKREKEHSKNITSFKHKIKQCKLMLQNSKQFCRPSKRKFMVSQNDPRKTNWELFVIVLALYNCFFIPFELAFSPPSLSGADFLILNSGIDLMFGIDIFVSFRTSFYHPITGDEIKDTNIIGKQYLRGRFFIDFLSTVPFDNLLFLFTQTESKALAVFSLLKLIRVTRLSRIIARLNVSEDTKNSLKLFQLIFFIVLYIHCSACLWWMIIISDNTWTAPIDLGKGIDIYNESLIRQYFTSLYHAVLFFTGNDVLPIGNLQTSFIIISHVIGAIINANILGSMAVLI